MPRILIMHASVGAGHASAANNIPDFFTFPPFGTSRFANCYREMRNVPTSPTLV